MDDRKLTEMTKSPRRADRDFSRMDSLRVFHDVARALTSTLDIQPLLRIIMDKMAEFFGPESWSLMLVDEEANDLYFALWAGLTAGEVENVRVPLGEGVAGWVAASGEPLVVTDVRRDARWSAFAAEHPELHLRSIACLPLRCGGTTLGILQLHNSPLETLPDDSLGFLRALCDYAAIALQNARQVKLIRHLSITDDCTGLFNARYLYTQLAQQIAEVGNAATGTARVVSIQRHFSLVFLDLDHFKRINDTHGHLIGSRLLAEMGNLLKRGIGPQHAAFRYGGDEFVLLLRGMGKADATALIHRLRDELNAARFLTGEGLSLALTASFGIACFPEDGATLHGIIRSADTMMYRVKQTSRNGIAVADGEAALGGAVQERSAPTPAGEALASMAAAKPETPSKRKWF